jgi:hypothetical protein
MTLRTRLLPETVIAFVCKAEYQLCVCFNSTGLALFNIAQLRTDNGADVRDLSLGSYSDKGGFHLRFNEPMAGTMSTLAITGEYNSCVVC